MNLIQVADNQIPISFHTGPGPQAGALLDEEELWLSWMSRSPAGGRRSAPLHMSTAHRRQVFQKSHTPEQSWGCTHESSVPSQDILVGTVSYTQACALWREAEGGSPPSTHKSLWYEQKPFVNPKRTTI